MTARVFDLLRIRAALARLDAIAAAHPELCEPEAQERLARALDAGIAEPTGDDGEEVQPADKPTD